MARVYREAPLNSIWEGSGNVNALDVLRALGREAGAWEGFRDEVVLGLGRRRRAWTPRSRRSTRELADTVGDRGPRPPDRRADGAGAAGVAAGAVRSPGGRRRVLRVPARRRLGALVRHDAAGHRHPRDRRASDAEGRLTLLAQRAATGGRTGSPSTACTEPPRSAAPRRVIVLRSSSSIRRLLVRRLALFLSCRSDRRSRTVLVGSGPLRGDSAPTGRHDPKTRRSAGTPTTREPAASRSATTTSSTAGCGTRAARSATSPATCRRRTRCRRDHGRQPRDGRDRRRVRRPAAPSTTSASTASQFGPACVHHGQRLLPQGRPDRRARLSRGRRRLGPGDLARPRHGVGGLPELPHPAGRGDHRRRWRTSARRRTPPPGWAPNAISNSYGGSDASDRSYGRYYHHSGIAVVGVGRRQRVRRQLSGVLEVGDRGRRHDPGRGRRRHARLLRDRVERLRQRLLGPQRRDLAAAVDHRMPRPRGERRRCGRRPGDRRRGLRQLRLPGHPAAG